VQGVTLDVIQEWWTWQSAENDRGMMKADRQGAAPVRPGTQFGYSNSGFIVLGAIIEHVSRHRYDDWVARQVLRPAGMASTAIRTYKPADAPADG
jgi:CubicO group peptidase (beta-lactamase class C family)